MKRILQLTLAALLMGLAIGAWAQEISLGDYARKQREQQKPASPTTRVFTNDDLSTSAPLSDTAKPSPKDTSSDTTSAATSPEKEKEKDKVADNKKAIEDFKSRVAEQKTKIAEIQRNLDVSNREFKLRSIEWYTQTGNALLDPKKFKDEQDKHDKEVADLQKQLADAQAKLEAIREEIRQAGLSSSIGD